MHSLLLPSILHVLATTCLAVACSACSSDDIGSSDASTPDSCPVDVSLDCEPLYQPTFDNLFQNRLRATCGAASTGGSCHSEAGAMAGLVLTDKDTAYAMLLGKDGYHQRVIPGDPACSLLVERIMSSDLNFQMPPGDPLSDAEQCAILKWIANGATR